MVLKHCVGVLCFSLSGAMHESVDIKYAFVPL